VKILKEKYGKCLEYDMEDA